MLTIRDVADDLPPAGLAEVIGPEREQAMAGAAADIRRMLDGGTLWHVNSTGAGGGVAEMLSTLIPLYRHLGVSARWAVIGGDARFFALTKRLGLALYGAPGDSGPLGDGERSAYLDTLGRAQHRMSTMVGARDVVILHDHQTAGLVPMLAGRVRAALWRCHVGVDEPNEHSERGWGFLHPLLQPADGLLFSVERHVPRRLRDRAVTVLAPFIAPASPKNCDLDAEDVVAALIHCGLRAPEGRRGGRVRTPHGSVPLRHPVQLVSEAYAEPGQPLLSQVSRWDRLKDMDGVLHAFAAHVPDGYLALVGPDPDGVADDTEQGHWYRRCLADWRALPGRERRRIALVCLPMADLAENAVLVNAVQRSADGVVQKSLAEGFGLTVTEAMWKSRVVVASAVGGISAQITDGESGLLVADPRDLDRFGTLMATVAKGGVDHEAIGTRARERVRRDYLPDREVAVTARLLRTL